MNHSALKVIAMKINAPAATQISVGFVFLWRFLLKQTMFVLDKRYSQAKSINIVIFLEFHSTKKGLPLVDSWSRGLD